MKWRPSEAARLVFSLLILIPLTLLIPLTWNGEDAIAANHAILYGGNDDPTDEFNQFLPNMTALAQGLKNHQWRLQLLYGGNDGARCTQPAKSPLCRSLPSSPHCCPTGIDPQRWNVTQLATALEVPPEAIPAANHGNLMAALAKARQELTTGDQLLVAIDTHGTPGHFRGSSGNVPYADPQIGQLLAGIKSQGVRIGFLLGPCYSGSALQSLNKYGCVVSSASSQEVSYYQWRRNWRTALTPSGEEHREQHYSFDSAWKATVAYSTFPKKAPPCPSL